MNLLLTGAFQYSDKQIKALEQLDTRLVLAQNEITKLDIDVSDIHGVICNGLFLYNDIRDFKSLKYIQLTSAGLDRVPMDYISTHDIALYHAKGVYSVPMAEWVLGKVLEIYKSSRTFYNSQEKKQWHKNRGLIELQGKTACIIGVGSVGREVTVRFTAMGCHTIGVDLYKTESTDEAFLIEDMDIALKKSDIVILTLPLTEQTKHMFNKDRFNIMKNDAVLVNVSRGDIINENDLIEVISTGKFMGVALDVFKNEPLAETSPLWHMPNVIITPHNSFVSNKNSERMFEMIYENLKHYIFTQLGW